MVENMVINRKNNRQQLLQRLWGIGFSEVSGGKLVLNLKYLLRLFAIARVANPNNGLNLGQQLMQTAKR